MEFSDIVIVFVVWLCVMSLVIMIVGMRNAVSAFRRPSTLYKEWSTAHPAEQVISSILNGVLYANSDYRVEHVNDDASSIIISDGITSVSWGMFYQISVSSLNAERTTVRVAVASKFPQWKIIVLRRLEKCFGFAQATVLAQPR